jgi:HSP20 family protein
MVWDIWDPFEEMKKFRKEMEKAFEEFYKKPVISRKERALMREPLADIQETDKEIIVRAELPGIEKKDIDLKITESMLGIKAEKKAEAVEKKKGFFRQERSYAGYQRAFSLPAKVIPDKAKAEFRNGVLTVTIPKKEKKKIREEKVKKIPIK